MKNFLSLIALSLCIAFGASAQSTTPRWGGGPPQNDNTGRVLTYAWKTPSYASTYTVNTTAYETTVKMGSLTGAQTIYATLTSAYAGDHLTFVFTSDTASAGHVVTFSTGFVTSGTLTTDMSQKSAITFVFDGVAWIATGREKQ